MKITQYEAGIANNRAVREDKKLIRALHKQGLSLEMIHRRTGRSIWFIKEEIDRDNKTYDGQTKTVKTAEDREERYIKIESMRAEGMSYSKISEALGFYPGYASRFVNNHKNRMKRPVKTKEQRNVEIASRIKKLLKGGMSQTEASLHMGHAASYVGNFVFLNKHLFKEGETVGKRK